MKTKRFKKFKLTKRKIKKIKKRIESFSYPFFIFLFSLALISSIDLFLFSRRIEREKQINKNLENILIDLDKLNNSVNEIENKIKGIDFFILNKNINYDLNPLIKKYPQLKNYLPKIKEEIKKNSSKWPLDILFVLALMKIESNFNWKAISPVGACGLFQIMPEVAKYYKKEGEKLFIPDYYVKGLKLIREAYKYKHLAEKSFFNHNISLAIKYKEIYERKMKEGKRLMEKYRKELLELIEGKSLEEILRIHFILNRDRNTEVGIELLSEYAKKYRGDASMILTAYIAGQGKAKKYGGLNPYDKGVVNYFNWIKNQYKKFRKRCKQLKND